MNRVFSAAALAALVLSGPVVYGQSFPTGIIQGRVLDDHQAPIAGAMVSVVGRATVAVSTDRDGRYALKNLPYGPYILSVHSRGFYQSRARTIQLNAANLAAPTVLLTRPGATGDAQKSQPKQGDAKPTTSLAGFGGLDLAALRTELAKDDGAAESTDASTDGSGDDDGGETAWRLRHLPRSILKDSATDVWVADNPRPINSEPFERVVAVGPASLFSDLALTGQVNFLTSESFDRPGQLFGPNGVGHGIAFVSVGTQAVGGAWSMEGAMTQGDLASWIVAGSYKSIDSARHAYDVGLTYGTQQYSGGNADALAAIRGNARNVGRVYGDDQWTITPKLVLGYGAAYERYDYLEGSGLLSPRLSVTVPVSGFRIAAIAARQAVVPGAEEFAPAASGLWLPPERTFSSMAADGSFRPEQTRHVEISMERDLAPGVSVLVRGFNQRVDDQLVEMFGVDVLGDSPAPVGHYFVGTAGNVDARGWGVGMVQEVPGFVRAAVEYTMATTTWQPELQRSGLTHAAFPSSENVYDLLTTVEATIPVTATKVLAKYRMNSAFGGAEADAFARPNANARFNVRVNQSLPFMRFSSADWEALFDIRNMLRDDDRYASLYDEALAVRAPKRVVGGLMVKF